VIQPHGVLDNFGRKAEATIGFSLIVREAARTGQVCRPDVAGKRPAPPFAMSMPPSIKR
jgi:hypothetical protein